VSATSVEASAVIIALANPATITQMNRATYYPSHLIPVSANKESNENMLMDPSKPKEELDINNSNNPFYYEPIQTADI